jgi:hypothetical protein
MTEMISIALTLLKVAFDETAQGNKLAITDPTGKPIKEIVLSRPRGAFYYFNKS